MGAPLLVCPLCSQPGFATVDSLRVSLVSAATRHLACPVCHDVLLGLDKFTIHLFSHLHAYCNNKNDNTSEMVEQQNCASKKSCSNSEVHQQCHDKNAQAYNYISTPYEFRGWNKTMQAVKPMVWQEQHTEKAKPYVKITSQLGVCGEGKKSVQANLGQNFQNIPCLKNLSKDVVQYKDELIDYAKTSTASNANICSANVAQQTPSVSNTEIGRVQTMVSSGKSMLDQQSANNEQVRCDECKVMLENPNVLSLHKKLVHKVLKQCPICYASCSDAEELQKHMKYQHDGRQFFCHMCSKSFKMRGSLMVHVRVVHNIGLGAECSVCGKQFATKYRCEQHEKRHTGSKAYDCKVCGLQFYEKLELSTHMETHVADKSHMCDTCGKRFVTRAELKSHESVHTEERSCTCSKCGKSFKKEQHLTQHMKTHEGKQWECDICKKFFTTKYFLKKHKRLHTGEMPYCCEACGKMFTFQQSYHKHLLYHSDEKPHTCSECGKSFKELSTLHNHQRIHTGEKPFVCETCGKSFRQRVSYLVHRRIHTGVMPYKCTACGKSFRYKVSHRTHKCTSQQPGSFIRQSSDFVQRLLQNVTEKTSASVAGREAVLDQVPPAETKPAGASENAYRIKPASSKISVNPVPDMQEPPYIIILDPSIVSSAQQGETEANLSQSRDSICLDYNRKESNERSITQNTPQTLPVAVEVNELSKDADCIKGSKDERLEAADLLSFVLSPDDSPSQKFEQLSIDSPRILSTPTGPLPFVASEPTETVSNSNTSTESRGKGIGGDLKESYVESEMMVPLGMTDEISFSSLQFPDFSTSKADTPPRLETINEESLRELLCSSPPYLSTK